MWYKGESEVPIYTMDSRKGTLRNAVHIVGDELRPRAHFDVAEHPPLLKIEPVRENDAGMYKCRVDFRWSRTMYQEALLNVIVPPRRIFVLNEKEERIQGSIGPFQEGDSLTLVCVAQGGKPRPVVTWWNDTNLVDDTFTIANHDTVRNEYLIKNLQRENLFSELSCQASNSNITDPVTSSVILDMYLRPFVVEILSPQRPLSVGEKTQILCRSIGSRPAANIHWWKDRKKLTSFATIAREGNYTISKLTFTPEVGDNGHYLSCRTDNPLIPNSGLEDGWILNVHCRPSSLRNCILFNITARGFSVRCKEGYDGGLNQSFHLEVYSSLKEKVFLNMTQNRSPTFLATNLPPSTSFIIVIYASNSKGRSATIILTATTTPATQELKGNPKGAPISPTLAIVIGVVGTLVVLAIAVLVFSRCRRRRNNAGERKEEQKEMHTPLQHSIDPNFSSKPKPDELSTPTELSVGNGKLPRRRELTQYYGLQMEDPSTHNIKPIFKGGNRNLDYPLDMCDPSGWGSVMSSV
ncbi:cell adhesion molecule 2-like isoform X2 [Limulus polyphemus]|uniref:Cell adhesion molecule 2-like isoform X2 n=1 Tax=Limulus polyphemus TaxID=6850 RepID=A0ABM1S9B1_LIMPO|nr:cell adhesion molecule 2-like isoform X2 [Limulus polyphemus]